MATSFSHRIDVANGLNEKSILPPVGDQSTGQHILDLPRRKTVPHSERRILGEVATCNVSLSASASRRPAMRSVSSCSMDR